ncbi:putative enterotoxin [Cordyceps sp. RAO-2017]|nr:putative enterotoxin [Cordyceps sp. RAO-2017]
MAMFQKRQVILLLSLALCLILGPSSSLASSPSGNGNDGSQVLKQSTKSYQPSTSSNKQTSNQKPKYVFRGDHKPPLSIEENGIPPSMEPREVPEAISFTLRNHMDDLMNMSTGLKMTAYVSTTTSLGVAVGFGQRKANTGMARAQGWVYRIRVTPNMVDMARSLHPSEGGQQEREYSALGGIRAADIADAVRIPRKFFFEVSSDVPDMEWDELVKKLEEYWNNHPSEAWRWQNENYHDNNSPVPEISGHPLLVGLRIPGDPSWKEEPYRSIRPEDRISSQDYARGFMERAGAPNGWLPDYPLFEPLAPESGQLDEAAGFDFDALDLPEHYREDLEDQRRRGIDCTALIAALLAILPLMGRIIGARRSLNKLQMIHSSGYWVWKELDLSQYPGAKKKTVALRDLDRVQLSAAGHQSGPRNDWFELEGTTPLRTWYRHEKTDLISDQLKDQTVATFSFSREDWHLSPPCDSFDKLQFFIRFSSDHWSGTYDTISVHIGNHGTFVASGPWPGYEKWVDIDLQKAFDKKVVSVREVDYFSLIDIAYGDWSEKDKWKYAGMSNVQLAVRSASRKPDSSCLIRDETARNLRWFVYGRRSQGKKYG